MRGVFTESEEDFIVGSGLKEGRRLMDMGMIYRTGIKGERKAYRTPWYHEA